MSFKNDGGPAFPVIGAPGAPEDYPGMTLRDYFAAKAMQSIMTSDAWRHRETPGQIAVTAFFIADAMIAARGAA